VAGFVFVASGDSRSILVPGPRLLALTHLAMFLWPAHSTPTPENRPDKKSKRNSKHARACLGKDHLSLRLGENADKENFSNLCSQIGSIWFRLRRQPNMCHMTLETFDPPTPPSRFLDALKNWVPFKGTIQKQWSKLNPHLELPKKSIHSIRRRFINCSHFFLFKRAVFLVWLLFLTALLFFGIFIVTIMNRNAEAQQWNHAIPLSPDIYLTVGVFVQVRHLPLTAMGTKYALRFLCLVSALD
jgi:hypothetical protein